MSGESTPARGSANSSFSGFIDQIGDAVIAAGLLIMFGSGGAIGVVGVGLAIIGAGPFVQLTVPAESLVVRAVAVGAAEVSIPAAFGAMTSSQLARNDFTATAFSIIVGYLAVWFLPGYRGRPVMLGRASTWFLLAISIATAEQQRSRFVIDNNSIERFIADLERFVVLQGWTLLVCSVLYLGGVYVLDRRGLHGLGTAFAAPALIAGPLGGCLVVSRAYDLGGSRSVHERRIAFVFTLVGDTGSQATAGVLITIGGAALAAAPAGRSALKNATANQGTSTDQR